METTALTINQNSIQAQPISAGLISDFISYIDRGEKTTRTYINNLKQFFAFLKYKSIARPIRQDVVNFREWLGAEHEAVQLAPETPEGWKLRRDRAGNVIMIICRPGTVRQYLRSVKQFFKWTAAAGYYPDIATNIHPPKVSDTHKKEALTAEQVLKIEKSIQAGAEARREDAEAAYKDTAGRIRRADEQGKRLYAMYLLAVNAGLRTIEIHRANIKDLEIKDGQARLYIWGKGHTEPDQIKALAPEVAQAIRDYLDTRTDSKTGNSPLFTSTGNRSGGKRIATTTISTMLKRAMQAAGYDSERLTAHSLRHTAGTGVMEITGNNIFTTQKYMRHSDPKTTEIYLHNDTVKAEAGIAADLYSYYHGGQQQQDSRQRLEALINRLNPSKLDKLAEIAAAIA